MSHIENMSLNNPPENEGKQEQPQENHSGISQEAFSDKNAPSNEVEVVFELHPTPKEEEAEQISSSAEGSKEHKKKEIKFNEQFNTFKKDLDQSGDLETKLQKSIDFMESSLSQNGSPNFKNFWEARNICLQLFKENVNPALRAQLWTKYSELSKEARRLKEILDEQSAFAVEQIEMAIGALDADIDHFDDHLQKMTPVDFSISCNSLGNKMDFYQNIQRELNLLNTQASRINALRKELIKTEMRVRQKNKFFQRLSLAGDKVFPRRKELIKEVSGAFTQDVDQFIAANFSKGNLEESLFFLREEIKALQGIAKLLTLNTYAFTHTRMRLSECWDRIKLLEKDRKKARSQQKAAFKQNEDAVLQKIQAFSQAFASNQLSITDANKQIEEIISYMREVELGRDELKFLRDELSNAKKPLIEKIKSAEQDRIQQEEERDRLKRKKISDLKDETEALLKMVDCSEPELLTQKRDDLFDKINHANLTKAEKSELERMLKPLRNAISDAISEKKEKALMSLSEDDRQAIQQLKEVLQQRKERRQEIKNQLETFRKASGISGLDFEQAMNYNAQINIEKERLEKINQGIKEIEQKIAELEEKI